MSTCDTCKHWVPVPVKHPRNYQSAAINAGGLCEHDKIRESDGHDEDALVYSYLEGGYFWTGPRFGCVHHEAKA
jgi:hypothetical protein